LKCIVLTICVFLASAPAALADITRGCSGEVRVAAGGIGEAMASIEGRGSCKNKAQANDCRTHARKEIDRCIAGLWRDRQKNALAPECRSLASGTSRAGAKLTWRHVSSMAEPGRLTARMAYSICCRLRPDASKLEVRVITYITGDKMCGDVHLGGDRYRSVVKLPDYDMDCNAWRLQGLCSR